MKSTKRTPNSRPSCSNCLSDFQVTVPEIGTFKAKQIPLVVLTSNNAREMSDALKRRCLHLYIDFPSKEQELAIIKLKVPEAAEQLSQEVVNVVQSLRKLDLKKTPGISETLDWVKALTLLNVQSLDNALVDETLDTIVKYEGDVRKAQEELKEYMRRVRARRGGTETAHRLRHPDLTRTCSTRVGRPCQAVMLTGWEAGPRKPHQRITGGINGGNIWKTSWSNSPTCCGRTASGCRWPKPSTQLPPPM